MLAALARPIDGSLLTWFESQASPRQLHPLVRRNLAIEYAAIGHGEPIPHLSD